MAQLQRAHVILICGFNIVSSPVAVVGNALIIDDMAKQLPQNAILHLPRWYRDNRLFHRLNYPASLYSLYVW